VDCLIQSMRSESLSGSISVSEVLIDLDLDNSSSNESARRSGGRRCHNQVTQVVRRRAR
jgi:hypothetical protein